MIDEIIAMLKEQSDEAQARVEKQRLAEVYAAVFCGVSKAITEMRGRPPAAHELAAVLTTLVGQMLAGCAPNRLDEAVEICAKQIRKGAGL